MPFCGKCGKEVVAGAGFCGECGKPLGGGQSPSQTDNAVSVKSEGKPNVVGLSDKWVWALALTPSLLFLLFMIDEAITGNSDETGVVGSIGALLFFVLSISFAILDGKELNKKQIDLGVWSWLACFLPFIYVFVRAAKTNKKYAYAISYYVLAIVVVGVWAIVLPDEDEGTASAPNAAPAQQSNMGSAPSVAKKDFSSACSFDEYKSPPLMSFFDENIESTDGNVIGLFIDSRTKDSILAVISFGESYRQTYKFIFNNALKDAKNTFCRYSAPMYSDEFSGEISSVETKTLKTSKDAEKELRGIFSSVRETMYQELREYSASGGNAAEYVRNGMKYLESGDNNRKPADYDLAVAEFDKAIRLSPNNAEAYYGRGRAYLRKGVNDWAVADYTQAIRLNPNDAISYSNRGRAYARLDNYDQAVADFEAAHRIDPNNEAIKQNLEKARRREKGL